MKGEALVEPVASVEPLLQPLRSVSRPSAFCKLDARELHPQTQNSHSSNLRMQKSKNNQSHVAFVVDRSNTTDWEGGTDLRNRSNDMHGHGVAMERHTMTIFYFARQIKHFKYSLSGQLVAIG